MNQPANGLLVKKNIGGEYVQRGRCHVKKSLLVCRTNENTRIRNGTEEQKQVPLTRRGLSSPSPLNSRNGVILLEGWGWVRGDGAGLLAVERSSSSVRALLGPARFVVVRGGDCGDVGDRN